MVVHHQQHHQLIEERHITDVTTYERIIARAVAAIIEICDSHDGVMMATPLPPPAAATPRAATGIYILRGYA